MDADRCCGGGAYAGGNDRWVDVFRALYPRRDAFLALRKTRGPDSIFLNAYWRPRFGLCG
ncbi:MAG TPA: hypothetical protein VHG91_03030 [Longimicrobium sp.]|nr:hypothetical protein [Longimicrobium sp.]